MKNLRELLDQEFWDAIDKSNGNPPQSPKLSVEEAFDSILSVIKNKSRILNDEDAYKLHEKLKSFFNRLI